MLIAILLIKNISPLRSKRENMNIFSLIW
uniref:Uncharacterized protein n=1 Tax=Arundo donax TaxID=35708 RepID=A0A0A9EM28_ARUDO